MAEHPIEGMMGVTMEKIRQLVDANTIIGEPITVDGATIIPISRVTFGFASGGSDFVSKNQSGGKNPFGGGGGAGATVTPVGFLVIKGSDVRMVNVNYNESSVERAVSAVPDVVERITSIFKKDK